MGKYLITGRPGSGKTTVIRELQRRAYTAHDTDALNDITQLEDQLTGQQVPWPNGPVDWSKYTWNWQDAGIRELLKQKGDVFIGAIVGNQQKYYSLFDAVFALTLSRDTLEQRLDIHEHRRTQDEKDRAMAVHDKKQARWEDQGLIHISSEQPVSEVVDAILDYISSSNRMPL